MVYRKAILSILLGMTSVANDVHAQDPSPNIRLQTQYKSSKNDMSVSVYEKLLRDADTLIKTGKASEAYRLLKPFEFERSGEERFDYLIGIAALDSGKADMATLALERVLIVNPNSAAARLDLARAYYQLGDFPRAKNEFNTALKQNPAASTRANIEKYLEEIFARESKKLTQISAYIEMNAGRDSNVNNSTSQTQIYVDSLPELRTLESANIATADNYYGMAAGGEITHKFNGNWGWYVGADLKRRDELVQKNFDEHSIEERAGITLTETNNTVRIGVVDGKYYLKHVHNSNATGINAEWRYAFSPANQLKFFGLQSQYRFVNANMQMNDYDLNILGAGWIHMFANGKTTFFGNLYQGLENDVSDIVTPLASPDGGRADGAKSFNGFRVGAQSTISTKTSLFAHAGIQYGDYSKRNYWFQRFRQDRLYDLTVGALWHWDKFWTLRPQLSYSKNDSNIVIYGYNKIDVSLTIRRDFR